MASNADHSYVCHVRMYRVYRVFECAMFECPIFECAQTNWNLLNIPCSSFDTTTARILSCMEEHKRKQKVQLTTCVLGLPFTSSATSAMGSSNTPLSTVSHVDSASMIQGYPLDQPVDGFSSIHNCKVASEPPTLTVSGKTPKGCRAPSTKEPNAKQNELGQ